MRVRSTSAPATSLSLPENDRPSSPRSTPYDRTIFTCLRPTSERQCAQQQVEFLGRRLSTSRSLPLPPRQSRLGEFRRRVLDHHGSEQRARRARRQCGIGGVPIRAEVLFPAQTRQQRANRQQALLLQVIVDRWKRMVLRSCRSISSASCSLLVGRRSRRSAAPGSAIVQVSAKRQRPVVLLASQKLLLPESDATRWPAPRVAADYIPAPCGIARVGALFRVVCSDMRCERDLSADCSECVQSRARINSFSACRIASGTGISARHLASASSLPCRCSRAQAAH